jgi:hypothetical protein
VVKHFGFARLSLWDQRLIQDIKDILADLLELGLNLLAVVANSGDVLVRALGFLLLFDGGDDAPGGTSSTYDVLVGDRQKVALINGQFTAKLKYNLVTPSEALIPSYRQAAYLGYLLHVCDHLIVTFSLLAEPREEGLAVGMSACPG